MSVLDPYPWRYINNPNIRYEHFFNGANGQVVFDPRYGYEQSGAKYPL